MITAIVDRPFVGTARTLAIACWTIVAAVLLF